MTSEYVVLVASGPAAKYPALRDRKAGEGLILLTPHILRDNLQGQFADHFLILQRTHLTPYNRTTARPPGFMCTASFQQESLLLEEVAEPPWPCKRVWEISRRQQNTVAYEMTCSHIFQPVHRQFQAASQILRYNARIHLMNGSYQEAGWAAVLHIPFATGSPQSALASIVYAARMFKSDQAINPKWMHCTAVAA